MKVYQAARKSPSIFKSLTGLKKSEFDRLSSQFSHFIDFSHLGRKHNLDSVEHALFFILFYYRHYCIQELMAFIFRVDQSQISRWISLLELPLARCTKQYIDRSRRKIDSVEQLKEYVPGLDVILDATERAVLTHSNSKDLFSGKKNFCTVKNIVCVTRDTKEIVYSSKTFQGARHDKFRFDELKHDLPSKWNLLLDLGFIGVDVENKCFIPNKASKNFPLTDAELQQNKIMSSQRCRGEHVFGQMKQFKILGDEFRGSARLCDLSFQAIAGIYNFRRQSRQRSIT